MKVQHKKSRKNNSSLRQRKQTKESRDGERQPSPTGAHPAESNVSGDLISLQQNYGNRAVERLIHRNQPGSASDIPELKPPGQIIQQNGEPGLSQEQKDLIAKNVSENMIIARFGDKFRNLGIVPEKESPEGGVYKGSRRPDDAPIVDRFRQSYNQIEDWNIFIKTRHPELWDQYTTLKLDEKVIIQEVKKATKEYKAKFRDLALKDIGPVTREYQTLVEGMTTMIDRSIEGLAHWYKGMTGKEAADLIKQEVHEIGTGQWRKTWREAIVKTNAVLGPLWSGAKNAIIDWQAKQSLPASKIGDLDYIGSLAKGYKGPPKQHVRFNPEKFDVDANLEAPSLAQYAREHDRQTPDRGRIFARKTTIEPLIKFADEAHKALVENVPGYDDDPNDPFDVAIVVEESEMVQKKEKVLEDLYALRETDREKYERVERQLLIGGYLSVDEKGRESIRGDLGEEALGEVDRIVHAEQF